MNFKYRKQPLKKSNKLSIPPGRRYGKLTVIQETERFVQPSGQKNRAFLCRCDCGNETAVRLAHLVRGRIRSCGCLVGDKHGMSFTKLYNIYRGIKNRCYSKNYAEPQYYQDKGITMCDEWRQSFNEFKAWAYDNGFREGLQIDRIDNSKGYFPRNCRFVTPLQQSNNRSVTIMVSYRGREISLSNLIHQLGKQEHYRAILDRIKRGWAAERAVGTPIRKGNYRRRCG